VDFFKNIFSQFRRLRTILCLQGKKKKKRTRKKGVKKRKKKEKLHPYLDFRHMAPAASFLPSSLPAFCAPSALCVLKLQPKDLETFQRSVTNEDHMCAIPLV